MIDFWDEMIFLEMYLKYKDDPLKTGRLLAIAAQKFNMTTLEVTDMLKNNLIILDKVAHGKSIWED